MWCVLSLPACFLLCDIGFWMTGILACLILWFSNHLFLLFHCLKYKSLDYSYDMLCHNLGPLEIKTERNFEIQDVYEWSRLPNSQKKKKILWEEEIKLLRRPNKASINPIGSSSIAHQNYLAAKQNSSASVSLLHSITQFVSLWEAPLILIQMVWYLK